MSCVPAPGFEPGNLLRVIEMLYQLSYTGLVPGAGFEPRDLWIMSPVGTAELPHPGSSGAWIRTRDLWVMSPAGYRAALRRVACAIVPYSERDLNSRSPSGRPIKSRIQLTTLAPE